MASSDLTTALASAGFTAPADLARLAQPALRLTTTTTDDAHLAVGTAKLGGAPDLPPGFSWPAVAGTPMSFIAQISLAETATMEAAHLLPKDGTLTFFYDARQQIFGDKPTDRGGWQVFWFGPQVALQRAPLPADLPTAARFHPAALRYSETLTLPQQPQIDQPSLTWTPADQAKFDQFWANYPTAAERATPQHQLLGHPDTLQDDMRLQCQLMAHGVTDAHDPRAATLQAGALEWQLLLQIDSDPSVGMQWGDGGILYYWLPRAALTTQQFDQSWLIIQTN